MSADTPVRSDTQLRSEKPLPPVAQPEAELAALREELSVKNAEIEDLQSRLAAVTRRMDDDLRVAASVQRALLPNAGQHCGLDVASELLPFREIGGDYYDVVSLGPKRLALAIGDVMGKGVAAALLASNLKASFRAQLQTSGAEAPATQVVEGINRLFFDVTPRGRFATFFLALFDSASGHLDYVNAGHDYPLLVRKDGEVRELREGGTVLGLLQDRRYESGSIELLPDDVVVFYTDGLTDRTNEDGEAYGADRLKQAVLRSRGDRPRIILYTLLGDVQGWSSGQAAEDDVTVVVAKRR